MEKEREKVSRLTRTGLASAEHVRKKPYEAPELIKWGSIKDLTLGGGKQSFDGVEFFGS
jgi:hypothetical protein